jgi:hypothetical protein
MLAGRDPTAWLRWSDSNSEMSSQNIPLKGRGIQPNSGPRDYSRLSCGVGEMQLGPSVRMSVSALSVQGQVRPLKDGTPMSAREIRTTFRAAPLDPVFCPRRERAGSYFSTSACSGNRAALLLAPLLLDFDAAAGAGSFTPLS